MAAIRKIILMGMKMIVQNDKKHEQHRLRMEGAQFELRQQQLAMREELQMLAVDHRETQELHALSAQTRALQGEVRAVATGQRQLQKTVDTVVRSLGRGRNGHS